MGAVAQNKSHKAIGSTVYDIVKDLRADTASLTFPIPIAGAGGAVEAKTLLLAQLDDHLLPRLTELSTPAIVVIAGSTGTGKSTITNSLVGEDLSPAGIIRPTTLAPVLIVNPHDRDFVTRLTQTGEITLKLSQRLPRGVALLDAPDLDSVREENRNTAKKLLESADLWLFVTTAQRYGDALPWKTLTSAVKRGTSIAMIMNRVPAKSRTTVVKDLRARLAAYELGNTKLFVVADQGPHQGQLPANQVAEITTWLEDLAGKDQAEQVIVSTLRGSLAALPPRLSELADATDAQVAAKKAIIVGARRLLVRTVKQIRTAVADHSLLDGAAQSTWSLFSSSARLNKAVDRSGYAKGNARVLRLREQASQDILPRLLDVLHAAGMDTIDESRVTLRDGLADIEGGGVLNVSAFPSRAADVTAVLGLWSESILSALHSFAQVQETKQVAAATKNLGFETLRVIVVAAVLGQEDAADLLRRVLGNESSLLVAEAKTELADHYDRLVLGEYVHVTSQLEQLGLEEGSSARIRVRLAELKKIR